MVAEARSAMSDASANLSGHHACCPLLVGIRRAWQEETEGDSKRKGGRKRRQRDERALPNRAAAASRRPEEAPIAPTPRKRPTSSSPLCVKQLICDCQLLEVVMDLGRLPFARFLDGDLDLSREVVTEMDLQCAIAQVRDPFRDATDSV